jgi:AcrR family transcriptional regulator
VHGIRARNRAAIEQEILEIGRAHLARDGAAGLSLRAVARDLGMVSSALYRYVKNRDELLTLLIVAAYNSLGDAVEKAHAEVGPDDLMGRWRAIGTALRAWALDHPHEYALVYGSPVPDYVAPTEQTNEPGTRVQALLVGLLSDAEAGGRLATGRTADVTDLARAAGGHLLEHEFFEGSSIDAPTLMAGLAAWSLLMGAVSSEVFHQLGDTVPDPDAYFVYMLEVAGRLVLAV